MILDWMEKSFNAVPDPDYELRNLDNYNKITLPGYMLGSQGRETGRVFAGGTEDYTVIYPKNEGDYLLHRGNLDNYLTYTGNFEESLLKLDKKKKDFKDIYNGSAEGVYLHNGVDEYVSIQNLETESKEKILLLRDSYATPVGAFLAQSFKQVDMLWTLRISEKELDEFLGKNHYDYVILSLFPEDLKEEAFPFGMEKTP